MNQEERIRTEEERLLSIFSALDENERQVAEGLVRQASFMLVVLDDLQKAIKQNGSVGEYKNGEHQYGTKQSAELQAYNQTLRSYNAVVAKLLKIVPRKPQHIETPQERWERFKKEQEEKREADSKIWQLQKFIEQLDSEDEGGDSDAE